MDSLDSYANNSHTLLDSSKHQKQESSSSSPSTTAPDAVDSDTITTEIQNLGIPKNVEIEGEDDGGVQITCFSDVFNDIALHFQIIRLPKQIYVWIGCNSARFGHLYAAAPTMPNNIVSVTSLLGGTSDNTGTGIARRIVLRTGLPVTLACNIPKDSPMLEAEAEKKLVQKLDYLGYTKPKPLALSS